MPPVSKDILANKYTSQARRKRTLQPENTTRQLLDDPSCHHPQDAFHTSRPRPPPPPLLRRSLYPLSHLFPGLSTIMFVPHMWQSVAVTQQRVPEIERQAHKRSNESREHTADSGNESAQLGQEAL